MQCTLILRASNVSLYTAETSYGTRDNETKYEVHNKDFVKKTQGTAGSAVITRDTLTRMHCWSTRIYARRATTPKRPARDPPRNVGPTLMAAPDLVGLDVLEVPVPLDLVVVL